MQWLIQSKFDHDVKVIEIKNNLERFGIPYTNCSVVPFSEDGITFENGKTYEDFQDDFTFVYGSYTLANIAKKHGIAGVYTSPNLAIDKLFGNFGDDMFNNDMIITTLRDAPIIADSFFVRPTEDTKSFCGGVMTRDEFAELRESALRLKSENTYATVDGDTMIAISPLKDIYQEVRFFVVNGKIATYSQYRLGGRVEMSEHVDDHVKWFAGAIAHQPHLWNGWVPDQCYCLDIAVGERGPRILETNCINSSGLYKIDAQKLVLAIDTMSLSWRK
jgi:hypothetical protein